MKSGIWKKELWPERVDAFLMCFGLALVPIAIGGIALATAEGKLLPGLLIAFGLLSIVAGFAVMQNRLWGARLAAWLFAIEAAFIVVIGNDGAAGFLAAIPGLLGVYYFHDHAKNWQPSK